MTNYTAQITPVVIADDGSTVETTRTTNLSALSAREALQLLEADTSFTNCKGVSIQFAEQPNQN